MCKQDISSSTFAEYSIFYVNTKIIHIIKNIILSIFWTILYIIKIYGMLVNLLNSCIHLQTSQNNEVISLLWFNS